MASWLDGNQNWPSWLAIWTGHYNEQTQVVGKCNQWTNAIPTWNFLWDLQGSYRSSWPIHRFCPGSRPWVRRKQAPSPSSGYYHTRNAPTQRIPSSQLYREKGEKKNFLFFSTNSDLDLWLMNFRIALHYDFQVRDCQAVTSLANSLSLFGNLKLKTDFGFLNFIDL